MSDTTPHLALPLIAAAQAQKHVTHNEALAGLDTLVQLACLDKDRASPPADPAEGDRYLVLAAAPTGAWAGLSGQIACFQDGGWLGFPPKPGWLAWIADEGALYVRTGAGWVALQATLSALQGLAQLGLGTTADAANPFAAKLNKALWTALASGEGGTGDLRYTLNKQAAGNVLSLLFQSGFSGRAELGLTGDDDLTLKVSPDGATFREALRVNRGTGALALIAGTAASPALAPTGDPDTGTFSPAANQWGVSTGGTERLRIDGLGNLGLGTAAPRTRLDTALGTLSGAGNDYPKAQAALSGGGTITWGGPGGRFAWSARFLCIPAARPTFSNGHLQIDMPGAPIPAAFVHDGLARSVTGGVLLNSFEALWAVHTPGGTATDYSFRITAYTTAFTAPSNWVLVACVNGDDGTLKLGTGAIVPAGCALTPGSGAFTTKGSAGFGGTVSHTQDNAFSFGTASARASVVYAATGSINTSDAREKTPVAAFTEAQIRAATALAREIGTFRYRDAVAAKGAAARTHVGLTVQRAIEILEAHDLDPLALGLICHDAWDASEPSPARAGEDAVRAEDGTEILAAVAPRAASPGRPAGDRYGFRTDELLLFLARGFEARLEALEAKLP